MKNSEIQKINRKVEEWEEFAEESVEKYAFNMTLWVPASVVAGAALAGFTGVGALGFLPPILGYLKFCEKNQKHTTAEKVILEDNNYAAILPRGELRQFVQTFGIEEAIRQIEMVRDADLEVSEAAETLYRNYWREIESQESPTPVLEGSVSPSSVQLDSQGAVDVKAVPVTSEMSYSDLPKNKEELRARLKEESPALLKLVQSPPIRLVGLQRTGKSTFAKTLLLLRAIFMPIPNHQIAYATPHNEVDSPIPDALNPFGYTEAGRDLGRIEKFWKGTQDTINRGKKLNLSVIWDEFGSYGDFEDLESLKKSLMSILRESSKHAYYPILIAHGDQASFYPGVESILTTLKSSTIKIESLGEQDDLGEMHPTGRVRVTDLKGNEVEIQIPQWLTVEYLLNLCPEPLKALLPPSDKVVQVNPTVTPKPVVQQVVEPRNEVVEEVVYPTQEQISSDYVVVSDKLEKMLKEGDQKIGDLVARVDKQKRDTLKSVIEDWKSEGKIEIYTQKNPSNGSTSTFYRLVTKD